jgi:hypothetical protein
MVEVPQAGAGEHRRLRRVATPGAVKTRIGAALHQRLCRRKVETVKGMHAGQQHRNGPYNGPASQKLEALLPRLLSRGMTKNEARMTNDARRRRASDQ